MIIQYYANKETSHFVWIYGGVMAIGLLTNIILKKSTGRARPVTYLHSKIGITKKFGENNYISDYVSMLNRGHEKTGSFPSGGATCSMVLSHILVMATNNKQWYLLALTTCFGRVY
eukprot:UN34357